MVKQCPVCKSVMYWDMPSEGVFLKCSNPGCNFKIINLEKNKEIKEEEHYQSGHA